MPLKIQVQDMTYSSYEKFKDTYRKIKSELVISKLNYEFHLSINESQTARKYGETYYYVSYT